MTEAANHYEALENWLRSRGLYEVFLEADADAMHALVMQFGRECEPLVCEWPEEADAPF